MSSADDLTRFLADLDVRRERLLRLAEPSDGADDRLATEVIELGEQLIVADEELRVQQEELESARRALVDLSAERTLLLQQSNRLYVVTDPNGVVVSATPAVEQLLRQPAIRSTPRPFATWFAVADRSAVRGMVGRVVSSGQPQRADRLSVRTAQGEHPVGLGVERMPGAPDGRALLRWELTPAADQPHLRLVDDDHRGLRPEQLRDAIAEHGAAAAAIGSCRTDEELHAAVLDAARRLVPGAAYAELILGGAGPDDGYPDNVLAVPLEQGARRLGVLTVHADGAGPLDADAELVTVALARLASTALAHRSDVAGLQAGLAGRQVIGGAVGVLVERHRITAEAAFERLVRQSQNTNVKLREIAQVVLETGQEPGQTSAR